MENKYKLDEIEQYIAEDYEKKIIECKNNIVEHNNSITTCENSLAELRSMEDSALERINKKINEGKIEIEIYYKIRDLLEERIENIKSTNKKADFFVNESLIEINKEIIKELISIKIKLKTEISNIYKYTNKFKYRPKTYYYTYNNISMPITDGEPKISFKY